MGVDLPDGLVRDYDLLQLLDEDASDCMDFSASSLADEHLSHEPPSSCALPSGSHKSDELSGFLFQDEEFLFEMELHDDAVPDLDMLLPLSSDANSWLNALDDATDVEELELDNPLPQDGKVGEILPPLRLLHSDSSLSEKSENSLDLTDDSGVESPRSESPEDDEVELLRREEKYLKAQKEFLEFRGNRRPQRKSVKRRGELKLLLKSQEDNQVLNGLATQQKMYADNFKAMLAFAPVNDVRMSLMTPLESYIRLGKDLDERRKTILSLRKEKLDMTSRFIEQKTQGMDCNEPHEFSDMFDKFGKHYCVNFTISRYDGVSIYQVARGVYNQLAEKDEALNQAIGVTPLRESTGTLKCNYMHQRIVSRPNQVHKNPDKMPDMESNGVFYCRFGDKSAVLASDYVDLDELHPYDVSNRIRKDMSSGVVLSAHKDTDGKKYVIVKRYTVTKLHMYPHKVSQKQQDRFFLNMFHSHDNMKKLVVDRVLQHSDAGCSCTGDKTSCCCASDEASIPCGGHHAAL
uniref:Uncharacterized protein n=1 Tax=Phytophthora ramorum TaxID=164328 RepID=H3GVZ3_PHYRM